MMRIVVAILVLGGLVAAATLTYVRPAGDGATIPEDPRRIVSLGRSLTEIVVALGARDRIVGATIYCQGIEESVPRVGSFLQPDFEAIVRLDPEVVLAVESRGQVPLFEGLARYDIPVERLPNDSIEDLNRTVRRLGELLGAQPRAAEICARVDASLAGGAVPADAPRVLFVVDHRPMYAAGPKSFVDRMIVAAGARNVLANESEAWIPLEMEDVIRLAPDVIVDVTLTRGADDPDYRNPPSGPWAGFSEHLPAVARNKLVSFPQVHVGVQIPDWIETLSELLEDTRHR